MYFYDLQHKKLNVHGAFGRIHYLGEQRWAGKKENGYYLLDSDGKRMSAELYTQINRYSEGIAACTDGQYWGYLDREGNELTDRVFGLAWDYRDQMARAAFQDGIAFIDTKQKLAFYPPRNTVDMRDFSEGLAPVQISQR
jgi:hypothetical protein